MEKLPTANELYKALEKAGILQWDEVESFEGCRTIRFEVEEDPYGTRDDWEPKYCGDDQWAIFSKDDGDEWEDEQGDYRSFDSEAEANAYLDKFFKEKT